MKLKKIINTNFRLITVRVLISTSDNQYLLLKRAPYKKKNPLKWDLAGGGVDAGETPLNAAIRETVEETGITFNCLKAVDKYKTGDKLRILFEGIVKSPLTPTLDREHTHHQWIRSLSELPEDMHPKTKKLIGQRIPKHVS
jgi:8-oxo-dGTP pyrophosphatase MutT (NUDIX family)